MSRQASVKIGDIFEIPLGNGKKSFGQFMLMDTFGPIIKVFDLTVSEGEVINIDEILKSDVLFYTYTGLYAAIRNKMWKIIGHLSIDDFVFPGFLSTLNNPETNMATTWYLWNGANNIRLGDKVPEELKNKEFLAVYSPGDVAKRIENGKKPFEELILTNKLSRPN